MDADLIQTGNTTVINSVVDPDPQGSGTFAGSDPDP
jgi:hypothetical protein